jgi:hypothetical protein
MVNVLKLISWEKQFKSMVCKHNFLFSDPTLDVQNGMAFSASPRRSPQHAAIPGHGYAALAPAEAGLTAERGVSTGVVIAHPN